MSSKCLPIITIFIAVNSLMTGAQAENIYKCGNTYSQSPCADGKLLNVDDSRDPQQKIQRDAATQREAELAKDMTKTRLANEKSLRAAQTKRSALVKTHPPKPAVPKDTIVIIKPKPLKQKYDKPKAFIALVPGSDRKSTQKRRVKETELDKQP